MSHIPAYVYAIFAGLFYLGLTRCFPRTIRVERLAIMPLLIGFLAVRGFLSVFPHPSSPALLGVAVGGLAGGVIGWHHTRRWAVTVDRAARSLSVPGDIAMFAIIMGAFLFEFVLRYGEATGAAWFHSAAAPVLAALVWALFLGMTAGRNLSLWNRYRTALPTAA